MKDSELRMIETMLKKQDELNSAIMKEYGQYNYSHMVQIDIGFGIANALITILKLADCRLMYLLALSEHLGFCLEEVYTAYMRKNAINMERLKNGY